MGEHSRLGSDGSHAWAVWSSWRGDLPLFAHTVRAMEHAVRDVDSTNSACTSIDFAVRADLERFDSVSNMTDQVTSRAVAGFDGIRARVSGTATCAVLRVVRRTTSDIPLPSEPGLLLEVSSSEGGHASQVRDRIAPAVSRGGFGWAIRRRLLVLPLPGDSREPSCGDDESGWKDQLRTHVYWRGVGVCAAYILLGAVVIMSPTYLIGDPQDALAVLVLIAVILPAFQFAVSMLFSGTSSTRRRRLRSRLYAIGFPAIELADVTPGRRIGRILLRLLIAVVVAGVGIAVTALVESI